MKFRQNYPDPEPPPHERARAPWDQSGHEPPEAFALFVRYLTHPAGTVTGFIRAEGLLVGPTLALAARWRWVARRAAFDAMIVQEGATAAQESARDLGRAHGTMLAAARQLIVDSIHAGVASGKVIDLDRLPAWIKTVVDLERLIAGEATSRAVVDLKGASPDALAALDQALAAIEGRPLVADKPPEPDGLN